MPADLSNPKLFKPALPRAPRLHGLFGTKNFRVHGFMEGETWPPQALTDQYQQMVKMLDTHLRYKRLEIQSDSRKKEDEFQNLKEQCRGGRMRLKTALTGDQLAIRTLFSHNPTLQRLYCSMPLYAIVKHANDYTFCMRRERDRLRYELETNMESYKYKLIEKADLEDRIKFEKEFRIPEEYDIIRCRTELSTSQTRMYAVKAIKRAYTRMIGILKKDENYFEPVLRSLEEDVAEQRKFIKLTVMLGYPVITEKEQFLRKEYKEMEAQTRMKIKQNINLVDDFKKKTIKDNKMMIQTVRKSIATIGPKNDYVRETKSMEYLREQREDLERTMKELQMITTAGKPKDIYPRFKITEMILKNEMKEKDFKDEMFSIMSGTIKPTKSKEMEAKFSFSPEEQERLDQAKVLLEEIQKQQDLGRTEEQSIAQIGNFLGIFQKTLYHMLDVLRHIDRPMDIVDRKYPNKELQLPLLDFEAKSTKVSVPDYREEDVEKIMMRVLDKIRSMSKVIPKDDIPSDEFPDLLKELRNKYAEIVEIEDENKVAVEYKKEEEEPKEFPNILTRKQIKQQGIRIVEKALEEKELAGA